MGDEIPISWKLLYKLPFTQRLALSRNFQNYYNHSPWGWVLDSDLVGGCWLISLLWEDESHSFIDPFQLKRKSYSIFFTWEAALSFAKAESKMNVLSKGQEKACFSWWASRLQSVGTNGSYIIWRNSSLKLVTHYLVSKLSSCHRNTHFYSVRVDHWHGTRLGNQTF